MDVYEMVSACIDIRMGQVANLVEARDAVVAMDTVIDLAHEMAALFAANDQRFDRVAFFDSCNIDDVEG